MEVVVKDRFHCTYFNVQLGCQEQMEYIAIDNT